MIYSLSKKLIDSTKNFLSIKKLNPLFKKRSFLADDIIVGWGRKPSGKNAISMAKRGNVHFNLLEDGFIRSIGLGVDNSPSFSLIVDKSGIYYDATETSDLEQILKTYDFQADTALMQEAISAISLINKWHISKYNHAADISSDYFQDNDEQRVLVIAQTAGDMSLEYGLAQTFTTMEMIDAAFEENSEAVIYIKIHPDVLSGKKDSDIDITLLNERCKIIDIDANPISILKYFDKVYTKTSQMGFEALLLGKECVCFGMPFYAGWGVTDDRIRCLRRDRVLSVESIFAAAYILYTRYYNPYTKLESTVIDTIKTIHKYKNRDRLTDEQVFFFGFSMWKYRYLHPYFKQIKKLKFVNIFFSNNYLKKAVELGLDEHSSVYIWGKKDFIEIEKYAKEHSIKITRVEDGFIRSVGLGSDLTQPYSLVVDSRGIYFDPSQESDLEHLLNFHAFSDEELIRAKELRLYLIEKKLSKYNNYDDVKLDFPKNKCIVLVPGQVEDDASIRFGANGMSNLKLLQRARENAPDAYIVFKPHPDVLVGNRVGNVLEADALKYCNRVVTEVSLDSVLSQCDEVHTMTSLVGFEALMRGIKVHTYGLPFYAGWGLSVDGETCARRKRRLNIDELVTATLILYPRYIDPKTDTLCEVEVTLLGLQEEKVRLEASLYYRWSRRTRNGISRKVQLFLRTVKSIFKM